MGSMPGALFQERWRCASHKPGIKVAPMPSITVWPPPAPNPGVTREEPLVTCRIRFPWTVTSPVYGFSPEPSMMRTLVKTTPFEPPNLSSAIGLLLHRLLWFKHSECSSSRVRPDVFRGESRAFLWLLDRCPMATSRQRLKLSALDPLRKPPHRARRGDRILVTGHEEGRAVHKPEVGTLRRRQSLTGFRETLRVLAKMALADERFNGRIVDLGRRRKAGCRDRIGDSNHPAPPRKPRPVPQAFARGVAGLANRAE